MYLPCPPFSFLLSAPRRRLCMSVSNHAREVPDTTDITNHPVPLTRYLPGPGILKRATSTWTLLRPSSAPGSYHFLMDLLFTLAHLHSLFSLSFFFLLRLLCRISPFRSSFHRPSLASPPIGTLEPSIILRQPPNPTASCSVITPVSVVCFFFRNLPSTYMCSFTLLPYFTFYSSLWRLYSLIGSRLLRP